MDPVELFTPAFKHDPFPTYRILRDHHPVYRDPRTGAWLLSRFQDVYAALADHETFSSENTRGADSRLGPRRSARVLVGQDQPGHTRIRRLVNRPLARGAIETLEPRNSRRSSAISSMQPRSSRSTSCRRWRSRSR